MPPRRRRGGGRSAGSPQGLAGGAGEAEDARLLRQPSVCCPRNASAAGGGLRGRVPGAGGGSPGDGAGVGKAGHEYFQRKHSEFAAEEENPWQAVFDSRHATMAEDRRRNKRSRPAFPRRVLQGSKEEVRVEEARVPVEEPRVAAEEPSRAAFPRLQVAPKPAEEPTEEPAVAEEPKKAEEPRAAEVGVAATTVAEEAEETKVEEPGQPSSSSWEGGSWDTGGWSWDTGGWSWETVAGPGTQVAGPGTQVAGLGTPRRTRPSGSRLLAGTLPGRTRRTGAPGSQGLPQRRPVLLPK